MELAYPLTGLAAVVLAATLFLAALGFGQRLTPFLPVSRRFPLALVQLSLGTGVLGYVAFAMGLAGWLGEVTLLLVTALGVSLLRRDFTPVPRRRLFSSGRRLLLRGSALACGLAVVFALLGAMLPEIEYDALWYHLAFPIRYLHSGQLLDLQCEHMSPTPQQTELLYTYGLVLGDARGAKLIHFGFGVLTALWTAWLAHRWVGRRWGMVAAALFITAPTVLWEMTTAYNDLPLAFLAAGAVALLLEWRCCRARRLLVLAAVLLGLGLTVKHLAFLFLAPLAVGVLLVPVESAPRTLSQRLVDASLLVTVAIAVALPWYIRAWYITGNPLFPMFYDVLAETGAPLRRWDAQAQAGWAAAMARYGDGRAPLDLLLVPWRATWNGVRYAGSLGPIWLLFLPLTLLFWRRLTVSLKLVAGLCLAYYLLWISPFSSFQLRYLVPVVPLLAIVATASVRECDRVFRRVGWIRARRALVLGIVGICILNLPPFHGFARARAGWIPQTFTDVDGRAWRTVLGLYGHERFLSERLESYPAVAALNTVAGPGDRAVWFGEAASFFARPELIMDFSRCVVEGTWGAQPGEEAEAYDRLRAAGITHVAWDKTRTDIRDEDFAIRSAEWVRRYAMLVYRDDVMEVYALRRSDGG